MLSHNKGRSILVSHFNVSLVIPAYNESNRMAFIHQALVEFKESDFCRFEVILVNDGSKDDTEIKLNLLINRWKELGIDARLISYSENKGKGDALKIGIPAAKCDFILTLDFDMSTSPIELIRWREIIGEPFRDDRIYIGDRQDKDAKVTTRWYRKFSGKIFNFFLARFTDMEIQDTQCGFKLYPAEIARRLFLELTETGWSHDIELLMRAQRDDIPIETLPVTWEYRDEAKISVLFDGVKMLRQIFRIKSILKREERVK